MNRKTISFILAVSAEHRSNNTLYNNLEEKVYGFPEPRKEKKLKSQRFQDRQDVKTCCPLETSL